MEQQVLCFGDSNTWGYNPAENGERYSSAQRWTGLLQAWLSKNHPDWKVAEEGLNGRTTVFGKDLEPHRVGLSYIAPCVLTHKPLAAITVMLGTNDTKIHYHASPREITLGMENILRQIHWALATEKAFPPILLMCPKSLNLSISGNEFDSQSAKKSRELAPLYQSTAKKFGCSFLDLNSFVPGECLDGIHLSAKQHRIVAGAVIQWIQSL